MAFIVQSTLRRHIRSNAEVRNGLAYAELMNMLARVDAMMTLEYSRYHSD